MPAQDRCSSNLDAPPIYSSTTPCEALRALIHFVRTDLHHSATHLYPPLRWLLIKCVSDTIGTRRLKRDQYLWDHGQDIIRKRYKEISNIVLHLRGDNNRWLPRLLSRTDGPYRDAKAYHQAREIPQYLHPTTASLLVLSLVHAFKEIAKGDATSLTKTMSPGDQQEQKAKLEPDEVTLTVVLCSTQALFECRTTLPERTYEKVLESGKKLLKRTQSKPEVRQLLGANLAIWKDFCGLFNVAIPVIDQEFFGPEETVPTNANPPPTTSMTLKDAVLMKDLERLNDLLTIARNILATTKRAQDLAGDSGFDQQVLKLIDICVRVTARAYEGEEPGRRTENQLGLLNASFKKVLITSLQLLHNFVMHNEKRKLLLWLDLFANSKAPNDYFGGNAANQKDTSTLSIGAPEVIISKEIIHHSGDKTPLDVDKIMRTALSAVETSAKNATQLPPDEAARIASQVMSTVDGLYNLTLDRGRKPPQEGQQILGTESYTREATISTQISGPGQNQSWSWTSLPDLTLYDVDSKTPNSKIEDLKAVRTPQSAAASLQSAKDQLMARLQDPAAGFGNESVPYQGSDQGNGGDIEGSDVAANGSVADEAEDPDGEYRGPGDQERGLLTDIPLVLAPQEIEALPMIIQAGIVNGLGNKGTGNGKERQDMQGVRCNILLAQESGRNLLRELLIFIAAWDLQDHEFYFKMMMQIMEAILENGLMPFAYQAFGEVKDIVSPAQSMVIKILTQIFRGKQGSAPSGSGPAAQTRQREPLTRVDLLIVKYIFTIFRQCIIPETCALIYLQGQIRAGAAQPDDFPLNLWDMERVYEGVYQFLEFFAVLTESEDWKGLLVDWEIVSELVTLLRELDASIPKAPLGAAASNAADNDAVAEAAERGNLQSQSSTQPVAVERPYDMPAPSDPPTASAPASAPYSVPPSPPLDAQEPSDFEWRNLKKLVVLVLSSLVWKSTTVQNQIRQYGGVEMILQCCHFDSNNPYIREHAIMCLRFLLEGNRENQMIVGELEARRTVPEEVLDKRGYETYIDSEGKVGLRARERVPPGMRVVEK